MKPITQPRKTSLRGAAVAASNGPALRVSVVIPTHNRAGLVGRAIASVLEQTFSDFELIVVDDGSKDNTASVVAGFADERLRFIRLATNGGVSRARNAGIAVARGEWVAFLDDDDAWLPRKLEAQLARVDADGDARTGDVYCLRIGRTPEGIVPSAYAPPLPEGDVLDALLESALPIGPSMHMVRRSALLEVRGFDESLRAIEDRDCWLRLAMASYRFLAVPEALAVKYSGHKKQLTENGLLLLPGWAAYARRWGKLSKERRGVAAFDAGQAELRRIQDRLHGKHVDRLVRSGRRGRAWRYVRVLAPVTRAYPWIAPFVLRALSVVVLGPIAQRVPRAGRRFARGGAAVLGTGRGADGVK